MNPWDHEQGLTPHASDSGVVFRAYADYYDALYSDKDYAAECAFLGEVFRRESVPEGGRVLDLGCGTGGHALCLATAGYRVTGVDRSPEMIGRAKMKAAKRESLSAEFVVSDVRHAELGRDFDAVISMFAVVSYMRGDEDLSAMFGTARRHLSEGGVFIFDCWHGPGVLAMRPSVTLKQAQTEDGGRVVRTATPSLDSASGTVEVAYEIEHLDFEGSTVAILRESHTLRYLFPDELVELLFASGFELVSLTPFCDLSRPADERDWNITIVARAV